MKFVTVDTNASPKTERLLRSCRWHGIPIDVIGGGRPYPYHGAKIQYLLEYLEAVSDDEAVMFVDGYDVVFLSGPEEIDAKFEAFGHPFVVSAEQNCNVDGGLRVRLATWLDYPKGLKPYRFINTGTFVGRAGYMRALLQALDVQPTDCEQTLMNRYFTRHRDAIALDYRQQIFTCTAGRTGLEEEDYEFAGGRLRNRITGSLPCVLHCPGKNYIGLEKLIAPLPIAGGAYQADAAERRRYRTSRFINRLNARIYPDNFAFHLGLDGTLIASGIILSVLLLNYLI